METLQTLAFSAAAALRLDVAVRDGYWTAPLQAPRGNDEEEEEGEPTQRMQPLASHDLRIELPPAHPIYHSKQRFRKRKRLAHQLTRRKRRWRAQLDVKEAAKRLEEATQQGNSHAQRQAACEHADAERRVAQAHSRKWKKRMVAKRAARGQEQAGTLAEPATTTRDPPPPPPPPPPHDGDDMESDAIPSASSSTTSSSSSPAADIESGDNLTTRQDLSVRGRPVATQFSRRAPRRRRPQRERASSSSSYSSEMSQELKYSSSSVDEAETDAATTTAAEESVATKQSAPSLGGASTTARSSSEEESEDEAVPLGAQVPQPPHYSPHPLFRRREVDDIFATAYTRFDYDMYRRDPVRRLRRQRHRPAPPSPRLVNPKQYYRILQRRAMRANQYRRRKT